MTDDRLMHRAEVEHLVSLKRSAIYRLMRSGEFPLPLKIGPRAVRWRESDIRAWIDARPLATGDAHNAA